MMPTSAKTSCSTSSVLIAVTALLVAAVILLVQQQHEVAITGLLGLVSGADFYGWILCAWVVHFTTQMDEDDLYDGGDRAGVVSFLPLGLSLLWLLLFITLLASRAVFGGAHSWEPILSQAVVWDAKLFFVATAIGLLLVVAAAFAASCFPHLGPRATLLPLLLLAAALAAFTLSSKDLYCGSDDCYSILAVEHDASPAALKQAYRRRSLACVPEAMVCSAEEFASVQKSYDVLSSSNARDAYDAYLLCRARQWELLCRAGLVM